jgi:hypothetical protein
LTKAFERFVDLCTLSQTRRAGTLGKFANFHMDIFLSYIAARASRAPLEPRYFQLSNSGSEKKFRDI